MKKTSVLVRLLKTDDGFSVRYIWPSAVTGGLMRYQEKFLTNVKAIHFCDKLKAAADFWGFSFYAFDFSGNPYARYKPRKTA